MAERPSRRERQRERNRTEILDAAKAVLEQRGVEGLTIEEVAQRAEFAVGSIYRYFDSKGELIDVLHAELVRPWLDELAAIAADDTPFEVALDAALDTFVAWAGEGIPTLQIVNALPAGTVASSTEAAQRLREAADQLVAALTALVARGQAQGVLVDDDPQVMAIALVGMTSVFAKRAARGRPTDLAAAIPVIRRAFLTGFRVPHTTG